MKYTKRLCEKQVGYIHRFAMIGLTCVLVSCSSSTTPTGSEEALAPPPDTLGMQLLLQADVEAGQERTVCRYLVLPDEGKQVSRFEHSYTGVSHHLLMYATFLTADEVTDEPFDCSDGEAIEQVAGIYYGAQTPRGEVTLPPDVAYPFRSQEVVLLEYHLLNPTVTPVTATARLNLWYEANPEARPASTLFFYHNQILLAPLSEGAARMRCTVPKDIEMFFAAPHMHRRGTAFEAHIERGGTVAPLLSLEGWEDVPVLTFAPTESLSAGDVIDFRCTFNNTEDRIVQDGPSAVNDEMCIFVAGYYPVEGSPLVIPDELCSDGAVYFEGDTGCSEVLVCNDDTWWGVDPELHYSDDMIIKRHACHSRLCKSASQPFSDIQACIGDHCRDWCWPNSLCAERDCPECLSCIADACSIEKQACDQATCSD